MFFISARRWFDGFNTYHSVLIQWTDVCGEKQSICEPFSYGYGEQYKETAHDAILRHFNRDEDFTREERRRWHYDVADVARRKDLHLGGKHRK
jgi:hypothetical protein